MQVSIGCTIKPDNLFAISNWILKGHFKIGLTFCRFSLAFNCSKCYNIKLYKFFVGMSVYRMFNKVDSRGNPVLQSVILRSERFTAYNGVIAVSCNDTKGFHADFLAGLSGDGKAKHMSFSTNQFDSESGALQEGSFSIFIDEKNQANITFNSSNVFYNVVIQLDRQRLEVLNYNLLSLHSHPLLQINRRSIPKEIQSKTVESFLTDISSCMFLAREKILLDKGSLTSINAESAMLIDSFINKLGEILIKLSAVNRQIEQFEDAALPSYASVAPAVGP